MRNFESAKLWGQDHFSSQFRVEFLALINYLVFYVKTNKMHYMY